MQDINRKIFEHRDDSSYMQSTIKGLSEDLIYKISKDKDEPKWMLKKRLKAFSTFKKMKMPAFGPNLDKLNLDEITYYARPGEIKENNKSWKDVPDEIKNTFERLGIPEAERSMLAGVGAQYESNVVYHSLKKEWEDQGVIFEDFDLAVKKYPDLVKKYFMNCVPIDDHKFSALHAAVCSGGTFLYVPKGIKLTTPLQAYFRMNAEGMGQFEHTLIIIEDKAEAHYIEGCSAPKYDKSSLHAGCVEIYVGKGAMMRYSSVENWSKDTYNLNTKRGIVDQDGCLEWVGGNLGSGVTMLYPCSILKGKNSQCSHLGVAFANEDQIQDTGAKVIHLASNTGSKVVMKSLSKKGGVSMYRGLVHIASSAHNATTNIECDTLILDEISKSDTVPVMRIDNKSATVSHEAKVGKLNEDDIFYLMSRGVTEDEAKSLIVNGFLSPIVKELPLEYAVELNRLIEMEMEDSVG